MGIAATVIDMMTMPTVALELQTRVDEQRTTVLVAGELDLSSAKQLRAAVRRVLDTNPAALRLDLSILGFIDSTGLGVLIGARRAAVAANVPFEVVPSPPVRALLERTGLRGWFGLP